MEQTPQVLALHPLVSHRLNPVRLCPKSLFQVLQRQIAILMEGARLLSAGVKFRAVLLAIRIGNIKKGIRFIRETLVVALGIAYSVILGT